MKFWCLQISKKANQILDIFLPYEARVEICQKFGCFLGDLRTLKIHSEINRPLEPREQSSQSKKLFWYVSKRVFSSNNIFDRLQI